MKAMTLLCGALLLGGCSVMQKKEPTRTLAEVQPLAAHVKKLGVQLVEVEITAELEDQWNVEGWDFNDGSRQSQVRLLHEVPVVYVAPGETVTVKDISRRCRVVDSISATPDGTIFVDEKAAKVIEVGEVFTVNVKERVYKGSYGVGMTWLDRRDFKLSEPHRVNSRYAIAMPIMGAGGMEFSNRYLLPNQWHVLGGNMNKIFLIRLTAPDKNGAKIIETNFVGDPTDIIDLIPQQIQKL